MRALQWRSPWRTILTGALALLVVNGVALPALACYGAAALGMGGAYTSLATGVLAIYWNQAGLALTPGLGEASMTSTTPTDSTNYNSFAGVAVKPTERLGVGFGQTRLASWSPANNETWNTVGVGYRLDDHWAVGGAYREVSGVDPRSLQRYANSGFDVSAQYHAGVLNLGLLVQDVGGPNASNPYYQNIRPSISLETDRFTLGFDVYDAAEIRYTLKNQLSYLTHQVGLEYRPLGKQGPLALRGGFYHDLLMYGGGLRVRNTFADVVFIPEWKATQFTVGVRF